MSENTTRTDATPIIDALELISNPEAPVGDLPFITRASILHQRTWQADGRRSIGHRKQVQAQMPDRYHVQDLIVLGTSFDEGLPATAQHDAGDIITDAIFSYSYRAATRIEIYWKVMVDGRIACEAAYDQVNAMLLWLDAKHNNGRISGAATYAARVLNMPEHS